MVDLVRTKAVETSYNYYGIEGQKITDRMGVVAFSPLFSTCYIPYGTGSASCTCSKVSACSSSTDPGQAGNILEGRREPVAAALPS